VAIAWIEPDFVGARFVVEHVGDLATILINDYGRELAVSTYPIAAK
jgi:hypothetical protein